METGGVEAQTELVMTNIKAGLEDLGLGMKDIAKATLFIRDMSDFGKINEIYGKYLQEPYPARACVEVARLPKDALVEIEVVVNCP